MSSTPNSSPNNAPEQPGAEPISQVVPAEDYDGPPENTPAENPAEATSYRGDSAGFQDTDN